MELGEFLCFDTETECLYISKRASISIKPTTPDAFSLLCFGCVVMIDLFRIENRSDNA
jgi:hypothetical protein